MGYSYRLKLYERIRILHFFRDTLEYFLSEIRFCNSTLPQCCYLAAGNFNEPYKQLFMEVYEKCSDISMPEANHDFYQTFTETFRKTFQKTAVTKKDLSDFFSFINADSMKEEQAQMSRIEQCLNRLETNIKEAEEEAQKKGKVVMSLGIFGGLFLSILFV